MEPYFKGGMCHLNNQSRGLGSEVEMYHRNNTEWFGAVAKKVPGIGIAISPLLKKILVFRF